MSRPRLHDDGYLKFLRTMPCCCGCGRAAPSEAAHIRTGFFAMGKKPDDKDAVPLNAWCHRLMPDSQHANEVEFWKRHQRDPFAIAARLYAEYGGTGGKPRRRPSIKPRKPRSQRAKIITSKRPWPKRSFGQ